VIVAPEFGSWYGNFAAWHGRKRSKFRNPVAHIE
jgi:hypothetical protein